VLVRTPETERPGQVLAAPGVTASLEEAFMQVTQDSIEYHAGAT
jgi:hypothetical protein